MEEPLNNNDKRPRALPTDPTLRTSPEKKVPRATEDAVASDAPVKRRLDLESEAAETPATFPDTQVDDPAEAELSVKPAPGEIKELQPSSETEDQKTLREALARIKVLEAEKAAREKAEALARIQELEAEKVASEKAALEKQKQAEASRVAALQEQATPQTKSRSGDTPDTSGSIPSATPSAMEGSGDDAEMDPLEDPAEMMTFPNGLKMLSHDALRMRLRRLCEVKAKSKKCHVDAKTREQYECGGEGREWLEIALLEALEKVGPAGLRQHKQVKAPLAACEVGRLLFSSHALAFSARGLNSEPELFWSGREWRRRSRRSWGSGSHGTA